jgi:hypothetical protein
LPSREFRRATLPGDAGGTLPCRRLRISRCGEGGSAPLSTTPPPTEAAVRSIPAGHLVRHPNPPCLFVQVGDSLLSHLELVHVLVSLVSSSPSPHLCHSEVAS